MTYFIFICFFFFQITENDDLPHKICFRCSAKVEELYEFIQKCTQSQHNLRKALGSKAAIVNKPKHRDIWEEKLNQSNISNDDICDALIKKAMEGIKDIPLKPIPLEEIPVVKKPLKKPVEKDEPKQLEESNTDACKDLPLKNVKLQISKVDEVPITKSLRSNTEIKNVIEKKENKNDEMSKVDPPVKDRVEPVKSTPAESKTEKPPPQTNTFSLSETTPAVKTFNIMDHVSMIKVNGVGVLFQCKLCNRNFLKKEVVMSHACAKNGPTKVQPKPTVVPDPPKIPSVKYINTRINTETIKPINDKPISIDDDDEDDKPLASKKPKPKIGPASRVKRDDVTDKPANSTPHQNTESASSNIPTPVVQFPTMPSLNSRYKLMPGPNNTFTLVEEKPNDNDKYNKAVTPEKVEIAVPPLEPIRPTRPIVGPKRIMNLIKEKPATATPPLSISQPYPVGLFKTLPTTNSVNVPIINPPALTPAIKKQSYTVVQTGNPSKLLISTKPQTEELPKKRQRKAKHEVREDDTKQPFSVTLEDSAPPRDTEFFTFINVDPLLQPSYVLPTNNIIQESQISTSTSVQKKESENKDLKYTCNMCNEKFSREKKLLSHIQSHYNKMDEEDQQRNHNPRKRKK